MRKIAEKIYNKILQLMLLIFILSLILFAMMTLFVPDLRVNANAINTISISAIILSMPGIVITVDQIFNPTKKVYKLSCKCPKCKHLIEMDMKEHS